MMDERNRQRVVVLRLGDDETTLDSGAASMTLAIGARRTAEEWFRHSPPTPLELENAIMVVEDEIARAVAFGGKGIALRSDDGALREIAAFAGITDDVDDALSGDGGAAPVLRLSLGAVENAFERLAAVALGRPAASAGLPAGDSGRVFAAKLLIVRELMHHLGFAEISVGG